MLGGNIGSCRCLKRIILGSGGKRPVKKRGRHGKKKVASWENKVSGKRGRSLTSRKEPMGVGGRVVDGKRRRRARPVGTRIFLEASVRAGAKRADGGTEGSRWEVIIRGGSTENIERRKALRL